MSVEFMNLVSIRNR